MVIFSLEEFPNLFIAPAYYGNEFVYSMEQFDIRKRSVHMVDLRSDILMIYGTQIKESMSKMLYESLVFGPRDGIICVNCNGACYALISGKPYRPIHNIIFDWTPFGVVVPNSVTDLSKKELAFAKEQLALAKLEIESKNSGLESSNNEILELKATNNDMKMKLQKTCEKVALVEFELELYKVELEQHKKEVGGILDELCNCKEEKTNIEVELCNVRSELHSTKDQLQLSRTNVKELEEQALDFKRGNRNMEEEVQRMQDQVKDLESSRKKVEELKDQVRLYEKEKQCTDVQLRTISEHISTINLGVRSSKQKLDQLLISEMWNVVNHHSHLSSSTLEITQEISIH